MAPKLAPIAYSMVALVAVIVIATQTSDSQITLTDEEFKTYAIMKKQEYSDEHKRYEESFEMWKSLNLQRAQEVLEQDMVVIKKGIELETLVKAKNNGKLPPWYIKAPGILFQGERSLGK